MICAISGGNDMNDVSGISVVVITLNEEANIRDCLDALSAQNYPADKHEIIVVDASADRTAEIAGGYRHVRVLRSQKGFVRQKNAGWRAARYDIVAFTDADCRVPNGWLSAVAAAFQDEDVMAVGGDALLPPGSSWLETCIGCVGHPGGGALGLEANVTEDEQGIDFIAGCNAAFRKAVLHRMDGFHPDFERGGEDVDLSRRLRQSGFDLHYSSDMFLYHKPHAPFRQYVQWNIGVGVTRWNLNRPGIFRMVPDPRFPVWTVILFTAWIGLVVVRPPAGMMAAAVGWLVWILILRCFSKPYRLFWRKRRKLKLDVISSLFVVPFLVLVRQVAMSVGEFSRWREWRKEEKAGPCGPACNTS